MAITFYSSRVILRTLGFVDFGIYNVVAGLAVVFSFLNSSLGGATSYFLTNALGRNNQEDLSESFKGAMATHACIALLFFLFSETFGLWFLKHQIVIPLERFDSAVIVYHLTVISCVVSIVQVPMYAMVLAHERMDFMSFLSITEALLKLSAVLLLDFSSFDRLILYATFFLSITVLVTVIYFFYCKRTFSESCVFDSMPKKETLLSILGFTLWDLYGNLSLVARTQGVNILLNMFFGPLANAASAIATQVQSGMVSFANNFLMAVRPQIGKYFASNKIDEMQSLVMNASKFSFIFLVVFVLPVVIDCEFVLKQWLKSFPPSTVVFTQLTLISSLVGVVFNPIVFAIHATGKIKSVSLLTGTIFFLVLPFSYLSFKLNQPAYSTFLINIALSFLGCCIVNLLIMKKLIPSFSLLKFIREVLFADFLIAFGSLPLTLYVFNSFETGWLRFLCLNFASILSVSIFAWFFAINEKVRTQITKKLFSHFVFFFKRKPF